MSPEGQEQYDDRRQVLHAWRGVDWVQLEREAQDATVPVGDLVKRILRELDLPRKQLMAEILKVWDLIVDPRIRQHARPLALRKGVLYIGVDSSTWLFELHRYHGRQILNQLQAAFGGVEIKRIEFRIC